MTNGAVDSDTPPMPSVSTIGALRCDRELLHRGHTVNTDTSPTCSGPEISSTFPHSAHMTGRSVWACGRVGVQKKSAFFEKKTDGHIYFFFFSRDPGRNTHLTGSQRFPRAQAGLP
jgi:hypothetical protein